MICAHLVTTEPTLVVRLHLWIRDGDPLCDKVQANHRLCGSFDLLMKSDGDLYFSVDRVGDRNNAGTLPNLVLGYLSFPAEHDQLLPIDYIQI